MRAVVIALCCGLALAGCLHVPIKQGNVLDAEAVQALRIGMTKAEVIELLGEPVYEDRLHRGKMVYIEETEGASGVRLRRVIVRLDASGRVARIEREGWDGAQATGNAIEP